MPERIRVVQMGLGPVGLRITRYLLERENITLAGAIDIDPEKEGKDLGELAGGGPAGITVSASAEQTLAEVECDIVVHATVSSLERAESQLLSIIRAGKAVVSTCEELAFPWKTHPGISQRLDSSARKTGVAVLATGVNPGFMMDFLPVALSGVCRRVKSVTVRRIQDAALRRGPFQRKIGAGITLDEFERQKQEGTLRHVGLTESMHMIASRLGWELDRTEDVIEPIVAEQRIRAGEVMVPAGRAAGVSQTGRGFCQGYRVVTLEFRASIGQPEPRDEIELESDPPIRSVIPGGVHGDVATCSIIVNAIPIVRKAQPGLRTMVDIAPVSYAG